ncbi:MAG: hypothetical protein IT276_01295 [Ignavibacteriaceae bacterium]|nr:hypothetical protein [Ignavibacteriaceae bacterium]
MISKDKLVKSIKDMPDKFSLDELLDRIVFLQKIDIGLEQSRNGKTISTAKAKEKLSKWLK